jgi:hypothetical protein
MESAWPPHRNPSSTKRVFEFSHTPKTVMKKRCSQSSIRMSLLKYFNEIFGPASAS